MSQLWGERDGQKGISFWLVNIQAEVWGRAFLRVNFWAILTGCFLQPSSTSSLAGEALALCNHVVFPLGKTDFKLI